ncbi:hypothetical protein A3D77_07910 [Candidatus Gottesmanbacteria bacterium RIFCSPHIGHO2_02_FULL_39_11]|uniref:Glycosyltransferase 2-like domain-containing protein n=1 Tax=Candidatus Gottesmanbacteria bacterium RIFCSPHIGHO2_02_FULL_39_11 TaxID=1798382 RepID=A0A1F5ZN00_9BACT|nr:MAG: hypothetical protein A3D77_07910 [Candidatus Gottesmanbacteria bacterium RIFCSPHIGHO2_02_FULL_39_11]
MKLSVIIPARNEEAVIGKMIRMLLLVYGSYIHEMIVVDDGSTDTTPVILSKLAKQYKKVKVIRRKPPHGVGLALRAGLKAGSHNATHILTMDADFIRNVPDLEDFFSKIRFYDGLIGSRYGEKNRLIRYPIVKKVCNRGFHFLINICYGIKRSDLTNNFKLYKKEVFDAITLKSDDYAINAETGLYPILLGYRIGEIPVTWFAREREMGQSKFQLLHVLPGYAAVLIRALDYSKICRIPAIRFFRRLVK